MELQMERQMKHFGRSAKPLLVKELGCRAFNLPFFHSKWNRKWNAK